MTQSEYQAYQENGFHVLGKILDDTQIHTLREEDQRLREFLADKINQDSTTTFISNINHYSEPVRDLALHGRHLSEIKQVIGENILYWFSQFVIKFPDNNKQQTEFPWHQDNGYGEVLPANNVTVWIALDDATVQNGCVWVVPGSHKEGFVPHRRKSPDKYQLIWDKEVVDEEIPVELKAGEAVMFTGLTLHRSKLNKTDRMRRALFFEYADANCVYKPYDWDTDKYVDARPVLALPQTLLVSGAIPPNDQMQYTS